MTGNELVIYLMAMPRHQLDAEIVYGTSTDMFAPIDLVDLELDSAKPVIRLSQFNGIRRSDD
jgi:hypothetical protein